MRMIFWFISLSLMLAGCVGVSESAKLKRQPTETPKELPGLFTLLLIGDGSGNDALRMAIFDTEGDDYSFRPVVPEYWVKRQGGLSAPVALAEAERFFAGHCAYNGYRVKSLVLSTGVTVGNELIPDYPVIKCASGNEMTVGYVVGSDNVIKVFMSPLLDDKSFWKN